jgi:hypothetical protein
MISWRGPPSREWFSPLVGLPIGNLRGIAFTANADLVAFAASKCENMSEDLTLDPRRHKLPNDNSIHIARHSLGYNFHVSVPE